ncbi:hypothetical protein [Paenibacillus sp. 1P07SE]|uniref:hypothetical protein n=1 Tax=Paenibacillus sp. 1P07SE TaxID=3132209 RepID=UPI0039A785BC
MLPYTLKNSHYIRIIDMLVPVIFLLSSLNQLFLSPLRETGWSVVSAVIAVIMAAVLAYYIFHRVKGTATVTVHPDYLMVNGKELRPQELSALLVRGGSHPLIGIVPSGRSLAPPSYSFRFPKEHFGDMSVLTEWARSHGVKVRHKRIITW